MLRLVASGLVALAALPLSRGSQDVALKPVELVDARGVMHTDSFSEHVREFSTPSSRLRVVSVIGPPASGKRALMNALFESGFDEEWALPTADDKPRCLLSVAPADNNILVVDADSGTGCEADRLVALSAGLADAVLMNMWHADVGRRVPSNDAAIQTLLQERALRCSADEPARTALVFVVHQFDGRESSEDALEEQLRADLDRAWDELDKPDECPDTFDDLFELHVHTLPHAKYEATAHAAAVTKLRKALAPSGVLLGGDFSKGISTARASEVAASQWTEVASRYSSATPGRMHLEAAYASDLAFIDHRDAALSKLVAWKRTVERGQLIGNFGEAALELLESALHNFDQATFGCGSSSRRLERRSELRDLIVRRETELYRDQVRQLESTSVKAFQNRLMKLLTANKDSQLPTDESVPKAQRKAEFDFSNQLSKLTVPGLNLDEAADAARFSRAVSDMTTTFDDSSPAKVLRMNRLIRKAQRTRKQPKNPRGMVAGLHLVAMIRQAGMGSLQGFCGYTMGPHSITVGYQNDQGSPEAVADGLDQEPLLRFQPKVQLDVDL